MSAGFKGRTLLRYTLFQIPDLILLSLGLAAAVRWWGLPVLAAYGLVALWLVKDVIMFPILRVAYESDSTSGVDGIRGALGVVTQPLAPAGYVRLGSELWKAELASGSGSVLEGSAIRVVEVRGLTLIVEPVVSSEL
jgi:membrane protein implicated in regulation of membrane protease activity